MNITKEHRTNNPAGGNAERLSSGIPPVNGPELTSPDLASTCPPSVIRGAKLHEAEIGIDWLRFTMPFIFLDDITAKLQEELGVYVSKPGMWSYRERYQFACGAFITFTDRFRECCIELTGDTCKQLGNEKLIEIYAWAFEYIARATRIDIRVDFKGKDVGLIDRVHRSCDEQELCCCRVWSFIEQYGADGICTGHSVQLGKRGKKGSGRFVRIYDKGLETGEAAKGEWERWETEFSDNVADQVCQKIIKSKDWLYTACEVALGAVDFRENNGSKALNRRPTAHWWDDLLGSIEPVLVKLIRTKPRLDSYTTWLRRCVLPSVHTMAKVTGQDIQQVWHYFTGENNLAKPLDRSSTVVLEYLNEWTSQPSLDIAGIPSANTFPQGDYKQSPAETTDAVCVICRNVTKPEDQIVRYGQTEQCKCRACVVEAPEDKTSRIARVQAQREVKENTSGKQFNLTYM